MIFFVIFCEIVVVLDRPWMLGCEMVFTDVKIGLAGSSLKLVVKQEVQVSLEPFEADNVRHCTDWLRGHQVVLFPEQRVLFIFLEQLLQI